MDGARSVEGAMEPCGKGNFSAGVTAARPLRRRAGGGGPLGVYPHMGTTGFLGEAVKGNRKAIGSPSKREGKGGFCYQCCHLRGLIMILQRPGCGLLSVPEPGSRRREWVPQEGSCLH